MYVYISIVLYTEERIEEPNSYFICDIQVKTLDLINTRHCL